MYSPGTTTHLFIDADTKNISMGYGNTIPPASKLSISGHCQITGSYFMNGYATTSGSQFFGKRQGVDNITAGMEIQNTSITGGNYSQKLHFKTHKMSTDYGRRMTISEAGNVGINRETPTEKLDINGNCVMGMICIKGNKDTAFAVAQGTTPNHGIYALSFGMGTGNVANFVYFAARKEYNNNVYGTVNLSTSGSDDRRKHNEVPITNALDAKMKLQCETYDKTYTFKDTDWNGNLDDVEYSKESGSIAQDVYKIDEFKEYVVVGDEKISWDVNYNPIFTYNIRATQELELENDKLKGRINSLESESSLIKSHLGL